MLLQRKYGANLADAVGTFEKNSPENFGTHNKIPMFSILMKSNRVLAM